MTPRHCCERTRGARTALPRGLCSRCVRGMRRKRKRADAIEAFRFAHMRFTTNPAGARRLALWALTL